MQQDNNLSLLMSSKELRQCEHEVSRTSLLELEASCKEQPQVEIPVVNFFAGGVYARQVTIPAGTVLVGKIHKHEHINVLLSGEIHVATEEGLVVLKAPHTFISPAGVKRGGYTITDTVWLTFHGTTSTDLSEIESTFIAPSYEDYEQFKLGVKNELDSDSRLGGVSATNEQKGAEERATTSTGR
jgi:quercetin dioxygenase-like cupin family protein